MFILRPSQDDKHIYQNFPLIPTKRSSAGTSNNAKIRNSYVEQTPENKSAAAVSKVNQRHSLAANSAELAELAIASAVGSGTESAKLAALKKTDSTPRSSNQQQQQQQKPVIAEQHEDENIYAEDDCEEEEEAAAAAVAVVRRSGPHAAVDSDNKKEEIYEDEDDELDIPRGWNVGLSKCKRKFFYNDFNKDRVSPPNSLMMTVVILADHLGVFLLVVFELRHKWKVLLLQCRGSVRVDAATSLSS